MSDKKKAAYELGFDIPPYLNKALVALVTFDCEKCHQNKPMKEATIFYPRGGNKPQYICKECSDEIIHGPKKQKWYDILRRKKHD